MNVSVDGLGELQFISAGIEASDEQSRKKIHQSSVFANSKLKSHAQHGKHRIALLDLQPEQLHQVLKNTGNALQGSGAMTPFDEHGFPQLTAPVIKKIANVSDSSLTASRDAAVSLSASTEMFELIAKIIQLSTNSSLQQLVSKLQSFNAIHSGANRAYSDLATELEVKGVQFAGDSEKLVLAQTLEHEFMQAISEAQSQLNIARNKLITLQNQVDIQKPLSALLQQQLFETNKIVSSARLKFNNIVLAYDNHVNTYLNPAVNAENKSKLQLNTTLAQAKTLVASISVQQENIIKMCRLESENDAKSLTFLIALMSSLINTNAGEELRTTAKLKLKLSQAAAKDAEKKAQEYDIQVRKAEDLQKTMGFAGKVMGWIFTGICLLIAPITGGTSIFFGLVGLAMILEDEIGHAVNGHSYVQNFMQSIMEKYIQPMIKLLADMYAGIFSFLGFDKATADMMGQIAGALATAILLIAGVFLIGAGVVKLFSYASKEISKTLSASALQRIMNCTIVKSINRLGQRLSPSLKMNEVNKARISPISQQLLTLGSLINTTVQTVGNFAAADMMVIAAKARAQLIKDTAMQDLLDSMLTQALDTFTLRMETVNKILENIYSVAENQLHAGQYIIKKMNHVAG